MLVYSYDATTGEYLGSEDAHPNPLEPGNFLIPAFATDIAPPSELSGFVRVFSNGSWTQVPYVPPEPPAPPSPPPPHVLIEQSYRASLQRKADAVAAKGDAYAASKLLLKSYGVSK